MIQKVLSAIVTAAVIVGACVLAVSHYHEYQSKAAANAKAQQQKQQPVQAELSQLKLDYSAAQQAYKDSYNQAVAECQKGVVAYANLSPLVRAKVPAPTCPIPQK